MMANNKQLTLSIIIPAYNEEHQIKECLDAIKNQTVSPNEVIVVDNNSTDQTVNLVKKYKFVQIISEKKQGITHARNRGFDLATSDIIGRIDADTVLPTDWVAKVKKYYSVVDHKNNALTGNGCFRNMVFPPPKINGVIQNLITFRFNRLLLGHYALWGSNMAMLRSHWKIVKKQTCNRGDIHEDLDLAIHLHRSGIKIDYQSDLYVSVIMKRAFDTPREVWPNLLWWPRTLKVHNNHRWIYGYIGSVVIITVSFFVLLPLNLILMKLKKA